jgi:GH18 family chitinase
MLHEYELTYGLINNVTAAGYCVSANPGDDLINFPQLRDLKANYPQLLVLISVGGASHSTNFAAVSADATTRVHFAKHARSSLRKTASMA